MRQSRALLARNHSGLNALDSPCRVSQTDLEFPRVQIALARFLCRARNLDMSVTQT